MLMKMETHKYEKANVEYLAVDHPSGITVYFYPTPGKSKSAAMIATKFGSINREFRINSEDEFVEVPDGIAHFLEHKLFEGEQGNAFDYYPNGQ